jgi:hypothetical protein
MGHSIVKVIPVPKHHIAKTCEVLEVKIYTLLTSTLGGDEWSALPLRKESLIPVGWRLSGPQSRSACGGEELVVGSCEHSNELSGSIKDGFLDWLSNY